MRCPIGQKECATYTEGICDSDNESMKDAVLSLCEDGFDIAKDVGAAVFCGYDYANEHQVEVLDLPIQGGEL